MAVSLEQKCISISALPCAAATARLSRQAETLRREVDKFWAGIGS